MQQSARVSAVGALDRLVYIRCVWHLCSGVADVRPATACSVPGRASVRLFRAAERV